jgi:hypothetical protein
VRRACLIAFLTSAAALTSLCLPASSLAGTYTWSINNDFTTAAPGANPDYDSYGARPWRYLEGSSTSPSALAQLPTFSNSIDGGLSGWADGNSFVAKNAGTSTVAGVQAGQLAMQPSAHATVAIGWTSPFNEQMTMSVSHTVSPVSGGGVGCLFTTVSSGLENQSGGAVSDGTVTVPAHGSLYLTVSDSSLQYNASCDTMIVSFQIQATVAPPLVTLDSPPTGSTFNGQEPTFAGTASTRFGDSSTVTVRVYGGSAASGTPVESLIAQAAPDGSYSVQPNPVLGDGQYTAQAEQDDNASPPDRGFSSTTTFTIHNGLPKVELDSLGTKPLLTSTPTLTGTASTVPGNSSTIYLAVFPGTGTGKPHVRLLTGTRSSNGAFSIKVTPGLPDGQYTAVAYQQNRAGQFGKSNQVPFVVKVHPPALTLTRPAAGSSTSDRRPLFSGGGGSDPGDSPQVTVILYGGSSASGSPLGKVIANVQGSHWAVRWPRQLALGIYTVLAKQTDDAGHTSRTSPDTFLIVPAPTTIGATVTLGADNVASVPITCTAPAGQTCSGNVLALTVRRYQTSPGGPTGQVRLLFAYVTIAGGHTEVVSRSVPANAASTLRRAHNVKVRVGVQFSVSDGSSISDAGVRKLQFG